MREVILEHLARYPQMQVQDAVKLIFQSEFAGGHLINNPSESLVRLQKEYQGVPASDSEIFTHIGGRLYRLELSAAKAKGIPPETINRLFVFTAAKHVGSIDGFEKKLTDLTTLCHEGVLPFTSQQLEAYLIAYRASGCGPVSHSPAYQDAYAPHYRVVDKVFKDFWQVFCYIDGLMVATQLPVSIAVDGNSASCKTTLSALLKELYDCNIIPMDHFFLQPHQRSAERLAQIGGNIDYERFSSEVTDRLSKGETLQYQRYNCALGKLEETITLPPKPLNIIEGVYSMHPLYAHNYHGSVYLYTDRETQRARILARNGEAMLKRFDQEWIPMEDAYFRTFSIKECCGIAVDTSSI